jgi:hypothetical protein
MAKKKTIVDNRTKEEKNALPKGTRFSGRTIGRLLQKDKRGSSESRSLRQKNQPQPRDKDRFPDEDWPKMRIADPTGKEVW